MTEEYRISEILKIGAGACSTKLIQFLPIQFGQQLETLQRLSRIVEETNSIKLLELVMDFKQQVSGLRGHLIKCRQDIRTTTKSFLVHKIFRMHDSKIAPQRGPVKVEVIFDENVFRGWHKEVNHV